MKTGKMKTSKMKTSINLKTRKMKNNYLKNTLKLGMTAIFIMALGTANAQTTTGSGASVRVIDNKGTIKYLQTNNGITSITSTAAGNKTTTTWQLGGTLTEPTTIATDGTNTLNITGLVAETNGINGAATTAGAAGYTLVVRDEVSGALKKILAADILAGAAITGIRDFSTMSSDAIAPFDLNVTGLPIIDATNNFKLSVYRNGIKLRFTADFTSTVAGTLNITANATNLPIYDGDVFEVHYLN